jgi:hypothetical protein
MNRTATLRDERQHSIFLIVRLTVGLLSLLICGSGSVAALAQSTGESGNSTTPFSIRVTHLLGFESARSNANGTLSIQNTALQFQKSGQTAVQIEMASVQDAFLGEESKQVGGLPMTLGKTAVPFGGGRVVSLFAHKKYDTVTLEYVDANGGFHGAIFQVKKGQGEVLRNELAARGAHVSHSEDKLPKQSTAEITNENK